MGAGLRDKDTFDLLMDRLDAQDEVLVRIEQKLDTVNGHVRRHCSEISWAKGVGWAGILFTAGLWGVWKWVF